MSTPLSQVRWEHLRLKDSCVTRSGTSGKIVGLKAPTDPDLIFDQTEYIVTIEWETGAESSDSQCMFDKVMWLGRM